MTTSKIEALRTKLQDANARETVQAVLDSIWFWCILAERDRLRNTLRWYEKAFGDELLEDGGDRARAALREQPQ